MKPLFAGGSPSAKDIDVARLTPWVAVTAPLIVLVLLEATRGFVFVRAWALEIFRWRSRVG